MYELSETLGFEHQPPVNENEKPPDSSNRDTMLTKGLQVIASLIHSWFCHSKQDCSVTYINYLPFVLFSF